jgi:hypothetical protein
MTTILRSRVAAVVAGALVLIALGYGAALATTAASPSSVGVCVTKKNVVVSASHRSRCPAGSHKISVGVQGPRGATGATGAQGPRGATGATGIQGPPGPAGTADILGTNTGNQAGADTVGTTGGTVPGCVLGQITLSAAPFAFGVPARGQILSISQNTALFSLLGTRFGGDGITTFALPDLRSAAPNGLTYGICMSGIYPPRN